MPKFLKFFVDKEGKPLPNVPPGAFTFYSHTGASDPSKKGLEFNVRMGDEVPVEDCTEAAAHIAKGQAVEIERKTTAAATAKA